MKLSVIICCLFLVACQNKHSKEMQTKNSSVNNGLKEAISSEVRSLDAENVVLQTILNRKSVRTYSDKEISQEEVNNLLKAGMAAPSSKDRRPWHFIVISDKVMLESLGSQLKNASCLKGANKAIVVCGDEELSDNCWYLDCAAAAQNILIAAEAIGIGAVWTAVYPYDDRIEIVNRTFDLQKNIHPLAIIPLGYPLEENKAKDKFDVSRIHYNKW